MELEQKLRNIKNERGVSLYDHILNIIGKIFLDGDSSPYENFERISVEIRNKDHFLGFSPAIENLIREEGQSFADIITKVRHFFKIDIPQPPEILSDETKNRKEDEEPLPINIFTNVIEQESISKKCGVSFGEDNALYIQNALKMFSATRGAQKCSFWGEISGTKHDYYIIESPTSTSNSVTEDNEEARKDHIDEQNGIGINFKYYFVSTDLLSNKWEELPAISARQMRQAKAIRHLFTGDLKRKIITSPEFDGEERHYVT